MILFYCATAYTVGLWLGRLVWHFDLIGCDFPDRLWLAPLALLPLASLADRRGRAGASTTLTWPQAAGFKAPRDRHSPALTVACALCILAGAARFASHPLTPCLTESDLAYYNLPAERAFDRDARQVVIQGTVSSYPLVADTKQRIDVRASHIQVDGMSSKVTGRLRLSTGIRERYVYGQPLLIRGRLVTPPEFEDFSYKQYLARKDIYSLVYGAQIDQLAGPNAGGHILRLLYGFRGRGEALLNRLLPEPYAALANGMLLGIEAAIPDELYEQFNLTGTSHVIVISGSNVALIAGVLLAAGTHLFGRRRAVVPALLGIGCFALLVGGDAAVMRAALMGSLFVYATAIGRRSTALVSLAFACWVMTVVNPLTFWDVGFQLSSAATAGLILFSPSVNAGFDRLMDQVNCLWQRGRRPRVELVSASTGSLPFPSLPAKTRAALRSFIEDGLLITIAANLTTLPLVVFYFGRLSVVSLLTNLLIAPVQPFIMLWGSAAILVGAAGLTLPAQGLLLVPWLSLVWTVAMVEWTAALPGASLEIGGYGPAALAVTYGLIFSVYQRQWLHRRWDSFRGRSLAQMRALAAGPVAQGVAGFVTVIIWALALAQPDGRLHLYFLDIGQGDGILIETPSGRQVLVDGGASPQALFAELGAVMPFWDREIDMLLLTHPDADHMAAQIDVPTRFEVKQVLDTAVSQANPAAQPWRDAVAAADAVVSVQHAGGWIDLGDGVALWVLWPPPGGFEHEHADNENSLVVKLVYGEFSVLLTGDSGLPSEEAWLRSDAPIASTVLKVGHHGSNSATGGEFVRAVDPMLTVIQVGADNKYGHPTEEVLTTLAGRLVLRNDRDGRVHVWSDGQQMWIDGEDDLLSIQNLWQE